MACRAIHACVRTVCVSSQRAFFDTVSLGVRIVAAWEFAALAFDIGLSGYSCVRSHSVCQLATCVFDTGSLSVPIVAAWKFAALDFDISLPAIPACVRTVCVSWQRAFFTLAALDFDLSA